MSAGGPQVVARSALVLLFLCLKNITSSADFPAPVTKCHIKDERCLIEQTHRVIRAFPHGNPEWHLPDLEPVQFDEIDVESSGATNAKLQLRDVRCHKFSQLEFKKMRGFTNDTSKPMKVIMQASIANLIIKSKYKINGNILMLPIFGEGDSEYNLTDVDVRAVVSLTPKQRAGRTYMTVSNLKLRSKSNKVLFNMTNLFNGDAALSENIMKLLNDNWMLLTEIVEPRIDDAFRQKMRDSLQQVMQILPYDDFFLPETRVI